MAEITPVTAAGGVLFEERDKDIEVLLIYRKGVWDLPKGKLEEGESVRECARREVSEEVGCPMPETYEEIARTYHEYDEGDLRMGKTTHWFSMETNISSGFKPEAREGIEKAEWYTLTDAKKRVGFDNLRTVLLGFEEWYAKKRAGTS